MGSLLCLASEESRVVYQHPPLTQFSTGPILASGRTVTLLSQATSFSSGANLQSLAGFFLLVRSAEAQPLVLRLCWPVNESSSFQPLYFAYIPVSSHMLDTGAFTWIIFNCSAPCDSSTRTQGSGRFLLEGHRGRKCVRG